MALKTVAGRRALGDLLSSNWDAFVNAVESLPHDADEQGIERTMNEARVQLRTLLDALALASPEGALDRTRVHRAHLALGCLLRVMAGGYGRRAGEQARTFFLEGCERTFLPSAVHAAFDRSREDIDNTGYQPTLSSEN